MVSPIVLEQPTGELWERIKKEMKEDVKTKDSDLATIKTWLKQQPHLPDEWDERCLMTFLRGCRFSLEKTKKKLDMYFTMRTACPEFFSNRDIDPELVTKKLPGPTLPGLTPAGRRVTISRVIEKGLNTTQLNSVFKLSYMMGDIRLMEEVGIAGDVHILDAAMITSDHLSSLSLTTLKKHLICTQEAYPAKLKELHVINVSLFVEAVYNVIKPILKEKIRKRTYFHKTVAGLEKYVPIEMLPTEYGGNAGNMEELCQSWYLKMAEYKEWFKTQDCIKANEALRPGKPANYDELFGIDGSFRQLSIN